MRATANLPQKLGRWQISDREEYIRKKIWIFHGIFCESLGRRGEEKTDELSSLFALCFCAYDKE